MYQYKKEYPRPQMVRDTWSNLNGEWDFVFDDSGLGEKKEYYNQFPKEMKINVPFTYETSLSGVKDEALHNIIWYERTIERAEDLEEEKELLLHFEGSDYHTKLWVNGNFAGAHKGGYARFSFQIGNFIKKGENKITVMVQDEVDEGQPRGKQRWLPENFACWYVQTTGIWKTVWMEEVSKLHIKQMKLTPNLEHTAIQVEIETSLFQNTIGVNSKYQAELTVSYQGKFVNRMILPIIRGRIEGLVSVYCTVVDAFGIKTWRPGDANLYDLDVVLQEKGEVIDEIHSYFGMREISIDKTNVLLNGEILYQRLILDQGYWEESHLTPPSEEAIIKDIDKILELGFNGVRKHQKIEDERFLYWCDVKGVLVWSEMAASYSFGDKEVETFTKEWMEIVRQNYSHPSIIVWTPFNESWGIQQINTDRRQQNFTEAIYHLTKAFDSMRPVITNDGWVHTISDILTLHDYGTHGADFLKYYGGQLEDVLSNKTIPNHYRKAYAEGYSYNGQPIMITEYGGIALKNESGWGYGEQETDAEALISRYEDVTDTIQKVQEICGYCYTQVTDVQQEVNGLMDIERNYKMDWKRIREINLRRN